MIVLYRCQLADCRVTHFRIDLAAGAPCPDCCPACGKPGQPVTR